MAEQSWLDRALNRPVSGWISILVIIGFVVVALWVGTTELFSDELRNGVAFPVLVSGMVLSLKEVLRERPIRWETLAAALLAVFGSVIVGFQATADAKANQGLAFLIVMGFVLGLATIVPLLAVAWIRRRELRKGLVNSEVLVEKDAESEQ